MISSMVPEMLMTRSVEAGQHGEMDLGKMIMIQESNCIYCQDEEKKMNFFYIKRHASKGQVRISDNTTRKNLHHSPHSDSDSGSASASPSGSPNGSH